jgi:hypothetical protein
MHIVCTVCMSHVICCTWFVLEFVLCEGQTAAVMKRGKCTCRNKTHESLHCAKGEVIKHHKIESCVLTEKTHTSTI